MKLYIHSSLLIVGLGLCPSMVDSFSTVSTAQSQIQSCTGGRMTMTNPYVPNQASSVVICRVASGENPEEFVSKSVETSGDEGDPNDIMSSVNVLLQPAILQAGAAVAMVVLTYLGLSAIVDSASHTVANAGHAFTSEVGHELMNLMGFIGSLVVALFEVLKVIVPAIGKAMFAFGKAAAPVVAEKSHQLSDAAAPYAAKATKVVSDAAAPYVQEATDSVTTNVVQPLQEVVNTNVVSPLQSAQEEARASVEATIQGVQSSVSGQINDVQNSVTAQVESTLQTAQKQVEQILH